MAGLHRASLIHHHQFGTDNATIAPIGETSLFFSLFYLFARFSRSPSGLLRFITVQLFSVQMLSATELSSFYEWPRSPAANKLLVSVRPESSYTTTTITANNLVVGSRSRPAGPGKRIHRVRRPPTPVRPFRRPFTTIYIFTAKYAKL